MPDRYKDVILANCDDRNEPDLERYWDEVALEYLCSAGRVRSDDREFLGETSYRSEYLDTIAVSIAQHRGSRPIISLNNCLRGLKIKANEPASTIWQKIGAKLEEDKGVEIDGLGISDLEWAGAEGDFSTVLKNTAEPKGFTFRKKKWRKNFGERLEFRCYIDAGMQRTRSFQLPLIFEIEHTAAPGLVFSSWLLDPLMPGFHYYRLYRSPKAAILGVRAQVDLLDTIGNLILNQPRMANR